MVVLIRDNWHILPPSDRPEQEIYYSRVHKHDYNVQGDSRAYHGDDNHPHQTTQKKRRLDEATNSLELGTLRALRHYRIIFEYLPYSLEAFGTTREMVIVLRDASIAHGMAATKAEALHRNINNKNIMFKRKADGMVQGYLIDWDLSLDLTLASDPSAGAKLERTGTWEFFAIRLLRSNITGGALIHNRIDDIESFYHLTLWMALRYTAHKIGSARWLRYLLRENFDTLYLLSSTDEDYLDNTRVVNIVTGQLIRQACFRNPGIRAILKKMRHTLSQRYVEGSSEGYSDESQTESETSEVQEMEGLKDLEDPNWLPNLLKEALDNPKIRWAVKKRRIDRKIQA